MFELLVVVALIAIVWGVFDVSRAKEAQLKQVKTQTALQYQIAMKLGVDSKTIDEIISGSK